jgi:P27 family predicted phage terminase small subunit
MGRKPTPTYLKLVKGNPGRRKLPKNEPVAPPGRPVVPVELSDAAKVEFGRLCALLEAMGVLTTVDQGLLAAYAQFYADWLEAEAQLRKFGKIIKSPGRRTSKTVAGVTTTEESGGYPIQSPYLAIRNRSVEMMAKLGAEFGLSPVSRTRVSAVERPDPSKDRAAKYFKPR